MPQPAIRRYLKHGTLPQLGVFEAVVRLGSFTRAAEELCMAQPTVSVQMKKLADTVGLPLVRHAGKRIRLTDAGRVLYDGCLEMFDRLENVERDLADLRDRESAHLQHAANSSGISPV